MSVAFKVIKKIGSILFTPRTNYQDLREVEQFHKNIKNNGFEYEKLQKELEQYIEYVEESRENYLESEQWRQESWNSLEEKYYECSVQYQREKEHKQNYEFWEASFQIDKMIGECRNSWLQNLEILNIKISLDHIKFHLNWYKKIDMCDSNFILFDLHSTSTSRRSDDISFQSEPLLGEIEETYVLITD
jgi:hypothetical protein